MKPYADDAGRRRRQFVADILCVVWIGWWIWTGISIYRDTTGLTQPIGKAEQASSALGDNLRKTANNLGNIPVIGERAARPLRDAATNADKVALASVEGDDSIRSLAVWGGLSIGMVPIMLAGAFYVVPRVRFARTGAAYRDYLRSTGDLDLLALRALTHHHAGQLASVAPDPVRSWRTGEPGTIEALAAMELHRAGLTNLVQQREGPMP